MKTLRRTSSVPGIAEGAVFLIIVLGFTVFPIFSGSFATNSAAYFIIMTFLGMSLSFVWGYTGIFSFGQSAFFGIGGYIYGIVAINLASANLTPIALLCSLIAAALAAAILGYFMFYGGVSEVYVGITTLAVTLGLATFMYQTAGSQWIVGSARLGGYNGMTGIPTLAVGLGASSVVFQGEKLYYLMLVVLASTYVLLALLLRSRFGYAMIAIRENLDRTELLGYNARLVQLLVFIVGGILAGFSGAMYAAWGNYMTPSVMALTSAALPVIWVALGGRKSLVASVVATIALLYVSQRLAGSGDQYALVIFGALLTIVMLFVPDGFVVAFARLLGRMLALRLRRNAVAAPATGRPPGSPPRASS